MLLVSKESYDLQLFYTLFTGGEIHNEIDSRI